MEPPAAPGRPFEATVALLRRRLQEYDTDRARDRLTHAVVRGATAGLALRGGLHLVSYVEGLLLRKRGSKAGGGRPGLGELMVDTLRWGAFLGSFAGVYVFSDEAIALLGGRKRTKRWRAFASGAAAGPTLLLTGPKARHTSLAIYILLRGLALMIRCGNLPDANPRLRALLAPTRWQHGDVALMCLSTMQIAYSWIILPQTLPPAYTRFLNKHGGRPLHAYEAVRELAGKHRHGKGPYRLAALAGTPQQHYCGTVPCEFLHPGQTCTVQPFHFFPAAYLRALPVYLPVYVIPALLVHGRHMVRPRTALHIWRKVGLGVLRSSLFLSGYCTLAWVGVCAGFNLTGRTTASVITGFAWVAGLATLLEKKSRRMELALYCLSRVVESFGLCLVEWGMVRPDAMPARLDVLLFSLAAASICHCYSDHWGQRRAVFRSKYLTVFDFILGNTGFKEARIQHVPSNADLLSHLELKVSSSVHHLLNMAGGGGGSGGGGSNGGGGSGNYIGVVSGIVPLRTGSGASEGSSAPASSRNASAGSPADGAGSPAAPVPSRASSSSSEDAGGSRGSKAAKGGSCDGAGSQMGLQAEAGANAVSS